MLSWARSGGTRNALTKGMIESFDVTMPDIKEQRAIAQILGGLDDKIGLNRQENRTLEAMAKAIFKSWFVDFDPVKAKAQGKKPYGMNTKTAKLFPDSFVDSELGPIPIGWTVRKIGNICTFEYGKSLKAASRKPGAIPVYGSNGQVGWHNQKMVNGPGIVVGRKGNPGIVKWVQTDFFPIDTTFYIVPKANAYSLHYIFFVLEQGNLADLGADSAVPGLNRHMAYMTNILLAEDRVIKAFDEQVNPIRQKIYSNEKQSQNLASIRDTLLPKLLSGEIRIKDAEKFAENMV